MENKEIHPAVSLGVKKGATTCDGCQYDLFETRERSDFSPFDLVGVEYIFNPCLLGHQRAHMATPRIRPQSCIDACNRQAKDAAVEAAREAVIRMAENFRHSPNHKALEDKITALRRAEEAAGG